MTPAQGSPCLHLQPLAVHFTLESTFTSASPTSPPPTSRPPAPRCRLRGFSRQARVGSIYLGIHIYTLPLSLLMCVVKEPPMCTGPELVVSSTNRKNNGGCYLFLVPRSSCPFTCPQGLPHLPDAQGLLPFCLPDNFISALSLTQGLVVTG